ncbi:hypothetical protein HDU76_003977, partial [Blyttiomyces sp. JEL0837]
PHLHHHLTISRNAHTTANPWDHNSPSKTKTNSQITTKSNLLTRYLNNDLTPQEIETHGTELWRIVFEEDLVDLDLNLLPQHHLPTIHNGLKLVKSRIIYEKLCRYRPDLIKTDVLMTYLGSDSLWKWIESSDHITKYSESEISNNRILNELSSSFIQLPIYHQWTDILPPNWQDIFNSNNKLTSRIFIMSLSLGYTDLAKSLLPHLLRKQSWLSLLHATLFALESSCENGNLENAKFLLSFKFGTEVTLNKDELVHSSLIKPLMGDVPENLANLHDIVSTTIDLEKQKPSAENWLRLYLLTQCYKNNVVAVQTLLQALESYQTADVDTTKAIQEWKFDALLEMCECSDLEMVKVLVTYGGYQLDVVSAFCSIFATRGDLEMVKVFAAVEGFDVRKFALKDAEKAGHVDVVEYLKGLK